jgi:4-amino-4-deoxy-L-arabinose transferase-like glycosyltransferase
MPYLQEMIHRFEVGAWARYLRISLSCLAVALLVVGYNWRSFRNMNSVEAMDAAQVARNLSRGKGFTTLFIRPLSIHLVKTRSEARRGTPYGGPNTDDARLKQMHPDLANPPVYPCVLAGLMKVLPFHYAVDKTHPFWSAPARQPTRENPRQFWRYEPDFLISLFNQVLFFAVIVLTFYLTRKLFDAGVAWTSAVLLLGCELMWRFSVSGLSTMLLLLIFTLLTWCLVGIESEAREPKGGPGRMFLLAAAVGLLAGLGGLTRYAFGWIIVPVVVFLILFAGARRTALCLAVVGVFLVVLTPWLCRNWSLCGWPFGTASFAVVEGAPIFPENRLARSLQPNFTGVSLKPMIQKLLANSSRILQSDVPRLGGNWAAPFFLVGLLLGFRNPAIRRLRYFLVGTLGVFIVVQALGRTQLSEDTPEVNSENLLVLLVPFVLVYGVSLFFLLLDQMNLLFRELRFIIIGLFGLVLCLPMIFTFLPPRPSPVAYPPYYPPAIQQTASWMKENELMMSDIPWAMAWYGDRQCIWLTLDAQAEFFAVNDLLKPIRALYLTPQTMDSRFLSQWVRPGEHSWGSFILESLVRREIPSGFPLRKAPAGFLPEQLFLADWDRWRRTPEAPPAAD